MNLTTARSSAHERILAARDARRCEERQATKERERLAQQGLFIKLILSRPKLRFLALLATLTIGCPTFFSGLPTM